jgi:AcrR family transcriptional regulator
VEVPDGLEAAGSPICSMTDSARQSAAADAPAGRAIDPGRPLPRGRHGLPRETVTELQRRRLIDSMVSAAAERGYGETRVVDVIARARVSRATFYDVFDDLEDCFLTTYDQVSDRLLETTATAFEERPNAPWAERIRTGMGALLDLLAGWPEGARFAIVEVLAAGPNALVRRDEVLRRVAKLVDVGRAESPIELPGITSVAIVGGVLELLYSEVIHGATAELPERLPDIVYWVTQPFLGSDAAAAERERARRSLRSAR